MTARKPFSKSGMFVIAALFLMMMWQGAGAATKYWVGGNGTWNASNLNWSNTSGGAASQTFATGDDAVFDQTAYAVTALAPNNPNSITFNSSGYVVSGSTITLNPNGAGIINVNVAGIATISSIIAGNGTVALNKTGIGTLILSGANTYTGGTTLSAGQLNINNATAIGTAAITYSPGTTIDNSTGGAITLTHNNAQNWNGSFTFIGTNALNMGTGAVALGTNCQVTLGGSTLTVGGVISGGYSLAEAGAGTLTLSGANTFTGGFTLNAGTLNINNASALGNAAGTFTIAGGTTINNATAGAITMVNYPQAWNGNYTFTGTNALNMGTGAVSLGANCQVTLGASTLTVGGVISGGYSLTQAGIGTLTLSGANTFTGGFTLNAGTLNINSSSALGTTAGTFTIAGGTINATAGAITMVSYPQAWNGDFTFTGTNALNMGTGAVTLGANRQVTVGASTLTVGGLISGGYSLAKAGGGTLTLSGANAFTGGFTLNAGTLNINNTSALGAAAGTFTIAGGTIINNTTGGAITMSNYPQAWNGAFTFAGTNALNMGTGAVSLGANSQVTVNASTLTVGGAISGGYSVAEAGAGTLTLSGANTFTGGFMLKAGTLNINNASALGTAAGTFTIAGGTINTTGGALTLSNYPQAWNGNFTFTGTNALNMGTGAVSPGANCQVTVGASTLTVGGSISGGYSLTKAGAGNLTLSGANTYTGATTINAGTLAAGSISAFGNSAVTLANVAGAVFNITGYNNSIGSLAGGGAAGGNVVLGAATLTVGGDNTSPAAYGGIISGTGSLIKTGTGILTLSGANTYTGTTTVSAGTLLVNGSIALGTAVTVQSGGTLGGTGTVNGAVTVGNGGTIEPTLSGSTGTLTLSNVTGPAFNASSTLKIRAPSSTADIVYLSNAGAIFNAAGVPLIIDVTGLSGPVTGVTIVQVAKPTGGISGTFSSVTAGGCYTPTVHYNATSITVDLNLAPTITTNPSNASVISGQTATFSVAATGTGTLSYQWYKNSALITSGATAATYITPATAPTDNGSTFYCVVTNTCSPGSATSTSTSATLTVNVPPSITAQPANQTVTAPATATFTVTATGSGTLAYQWYKNSASISGATSSLYTTPATSRSDSGATFYCVVTSSYGTAASNNAILTVNTPPSITTQPTNQSTTAGLTATFTVAATGSPTLTYQWYKNSASISGATSGSYTTPATSTSDNGALFYCVVTNPYGTATSTSVTLTVAPLSAPILSLPASGATGVALNPTLSWGSVPTASSYELQVSLSSNFSSTVFDQSGLTSMSQAMSVVTSNNMMYYWRVNASNAGATSSWSTVSNFTTIVANPSVPSLVSPANGATGVSVSPAMSWTSSTGAADYRLQIFSDAALSTLVYQKDSITAPTWTVAVSLLNNTQYYWRVGAKNAGGYSGYSDTFNFTTIVAKPSVPALVSPATGATGVSVSPALTWTSATGAADYRLQIFSDPALSTLAYQKDSITGTTWTVAIALSNSTQYYWRVGAKNAGGYSGYSDTFNFTTIVAKPSVPALVSPATGTTGVSVSPAMSWTSATGAADYRLQIFSDPALTTLAYQKDSITAPTWTVAVSLLNNTQYYWRVGAKNAGGYSGYSDTFNFTTIVATPLTPTIASPINGATETSTSPILTWNASTGATSYGLQISTVPDFSSTVYSFTGLTGTSQQITRLSNNTVYYWQINAANTAGTSPWSAASDFVTMPPQSVTANVGWNMISFNMQPMDSSCATIFGSLPGIVLVKNNSGQVYWPFYGVNTIGSVATGQGYQLYTDTLDTIAIPGAPYNVSTTPISLGAGWNMFAYLPQSSMDVTTALAGITSQITIVKDNNGDVYWPEYSINNIGMMNPGQGYMSYMNQAAALTYPDAGVAKKGVTADKTIALPLAKHYVLSKNTGVSATILATDVSLNGKPAADGSEVGAYDDQGSLVGSGVVMKGATAFSVWGKNSQKKIKDGLTKGETITLKLWDGSKECPLEFSESGSKSLAKMSYSDNGVFLGSLSVPSSYFIKAFAVHGTCMAGSGIMKIMFDVPYDNKGIHNVAINLFDVSGRLVHQIASGEYAAGHYTVMWNGSTTGAGMYIVQMKAETFDSKVRLMIVR